VAKNKTLFKILYKNFVIFIVQTQFEDLIFGVT